MRNTDLFWELCLTNALSGEPIADVEDPENLYQREADNSKRLRRAMAQALVGGKLSLPAFRL